MTVERTAESYNFLSTFSLVISCIWVYISYQNFYHYDSKVASVPELVGSNYLARKRKMNDVLRSKNLWRLVNGEHKKPTNAQALIKWEEKCDQVRWIISQVVSDSKY